MRAVYEQRTKNHDLEFKLVQLTTIREAYLQDFRELERAVIEKRRKFNDDSILDGMKLLNSIRDVTFDLMEQIGEWQKMFVKAKRPTIMNCDYLTEMITSTEFVNSSPIRKHFNFAIMRRNMFLLPLATGKPKDTVETTKELIVEIEKFANPDVDRLIVCYSLLQKSYPSKIFKSLMSLDRWVFSLWQPNVDIYSTLPPVIDNRHTITTLTTKRKQSGNGTALPQSTDEKMYASAPVPEVEGPPGTDVARNSETALTKGDDSKNVKTQRNKEIQESGIIRSNSASCTSVASKESVQITSSATSLPALESTYGTLPPPKAAAKLPSKKLLVVDTAVASGIADGKLMFTPTSSVGEVSFSSAQLQSAVPSPASSVVVGLGVKVNTSPSKVLSDASISTFGGAGGGVDGPAGGLLSTAQLRDWYKANAQSRNNEDSDDDYY